MNNNFIKYFDIGNEVVNSKSSYSVREYLSAEKDKLPISITDCGFESKPKEMHGKILSHTNPLIKNKKLTIDEIASLISKGNCYIGGTFNGNGYKYVDYINGSWVTMDFDNGDWSFDSALKFCLDNNFVPNIAYESFSSTSRLNKFHFTWLVGNGSLEVLKSISKLIYFVFQQEVKARKMKVKKDEDISSLSPVHLWTGTNKKVYVCSYTELQFFYLLSYLEDSVVKKNISRKLYEAYNFAGISTDDSKYAKISFISQHNYYDYENADKNKILYQKSGNVFFGLTNTTYKNISSIDTSLFKDSKISEVMDKCQLLQEVSASKQTYWTHQMNWKLLYNLLHINNGKQLYLDIASRNGSKSTHAYESYYSAAEKINANPVKCSSFCPYYSICKNNSSSIAFIAAGLYNKKIIISKNNDIKISIDTVNLNYASSELENAFIKSTCKISQAKAGLNNTNDKLEKQKFKNEISNDIKTASIIKVGTGLGKTTLFKKQVVNEAETFSELSKTAYISGKTILEIKDSLKGFLYCAPRHDLLDEVYNDLIDNHFVKEYGICRVLPRPICPDTSVENKIASYENDGFITLAREEQTTYIKNLKLKENKYINDGVGAPLTPAEQDFIKDVDLYWDSRKEATKAKIVLCTHAFLMTLNLDNFDNFDYVFIDEDCLKSFAQQKKIGLLKLQEGLNYVKTSGYKVRKNVYKFSDFEAMIECMGKSEKGKFYEYDFEKAFGYSEQSTFWTAHRKALNAIKNLYEINLTDLMYCKSYYKSDSFIVYQSIKRLLNSTKKIILMSATPAPEVFLKRILNVDKIEMFNVPYVKQTGKLLQISNLTSYRKCLDDDNYVENICKILKEHNIENVITYKAYKQKFEDRGFKTDMAFGSTSGLNSLAGQNLAVVGTYSENPNAINLFAAAFEKTGAIMDSKIVRKYKLMVNGINQTVTTYEPGLLRDYHLWVMKSELEQAIGRARAVRQDATVMIFSQLIYPLAEQFTCIKK